MKAIDKSPRWYERVIAWFVPQTSEEKRRELVATGIVLAVLALLYGVYLYLS